jgi:menaquinone-dependent protoporphyrinogen oxidase
MSAVNACAGAALTCLKGHDGFRCDDARMQPILVAYATTEGQTRKVAEFIAERLRIRGHRVDLVDVATASALDVTAAYQAAFLGGSVHYGRHQGALLHFVNSNLDWLRAMPTAFFSVAMASVHHSAGGRAHAQQCADEFVSHSGLKPLSVRLIAGALKYTRYDFFKRMVERLLHKNLEGADDTAHDHEYTDWDDVEAFVDEFLAAAHIAAGTVRAV